ncbi:alkylation response protein AidB-like acyl-CoA dehydrogenase [Streptomyces sp. V3I8]|uniref:acyl-CoA dehydrogenase family protein n=1 Tax=Streptomyces sp. V3I8 TaxID=3042279 RepID=UPI0027835F06|nr:acyl-CoA dehydrogenase family protein [Streptomyces sp. V3I8]MDQ1035232.1 alkylation response protein AidB-like acyl-CoA dehydrogenase [Streptomyces sp. V3I8]
MGRRLTEEQADVVAAVRDFAKRECGAREQRDALTSGGREAHNPELYRRIAGLGRLGVCLPEEYAGSGGGYGYGYATEFDMERHLRAAVVSTVYGGTSEIQRDVIGKTYGLREGPDAAGCRPPTGNDGTRPRRGRQAAGKRRQTAVPPAGCRLPTADC